MRYRLNPFTGLFDAVPVVPPDFITAVSDTATIDLTNTAGTLTADVNPDSITNALLAEMPTLTIKGNNTGGTANPLDLTGTEVTALLSTFVGDTYTYPGGGGVKGLVPAPSALHNAKQFFLRASGSFESPHVRSTPEEAVRAASFSIQSMPAANQWFGACWSPEQGQYVATSSSGTNRVATSPDGVNWTARSAAAARVWTKVAWSPELKLYAAVAFDGTTADNIMTSPDGITWTSRTSPEANQWYDIVWAPALGLFVAVSINGTNRCMTSPDGITWTSQAIPSAQWYSVTWSEELNLLCAVSITANGGNYAATSPDGITWTMQALTTGNTWYSVCWAAELGLFVAIGATGTSRGATSPDGVTWTLRTLPTGTWRRVEYSPELRLLLAVSSTGTLATSPNGITWTARTSPQANQWYECVWSPERGQFIILGITGTNRCLTSRYIGINAAPKYIHSILDTASVDLSVDATGRLSATVLGAGIDHGSLSGLADDDHLQYHTDARALTWLGTRSTTDLAEGTNLYFTDARARLAISGAGGSPISYNNVTGIIDLSIVPISYGGTGQSNAQAALNNLFDIGSHSNGDIVQLLAGNVQLAPYVAPGTIGNPLTLAYYDGLGNLNDSAQWSVQDTGQIFGNVGITTDNQEILRVNGYVNLGDAANNLSLYTGTLTNSGTLTGYVSLLNINFSDGGGSTDFLNGINIGLQGNTVADKQLSAFYSNGTVGGNYSAINVFSDDTITGNATLISLGRTNPTTGSFTAIGTYLDSTSTVSGDTTFTYFNSDADLDNTQVFTSNIAGDIAGYYNGVSLGLSGAVGSATDGIIGFNFNIQGTATLNGGTTGFNFTNSAPISGTNTFAGININNIGDGYRYTGMYSSNTSDQSEEIRGFFHNTTGDTRTSTGIDVYMDGNATDDAQAIRVNIANQTSTTTRVRSLDINGHTFSFNGLYRPASSLTVDTANNNFLEHRVASGSPLTGTDALINSHIVAYLTEDDIALGSTGLGQATSAAISLLGIADTKTVDLIRGFLVAASIQDPGYADAGTLDKFQGIVYAGALPAGGSTVVNEAIGLYMPTTFDSYATANWGIRVEGATADNYLNKLAIGTSSFTAASGLLLDVNGEVGITDVGSGLSIAEGANARMGVDTLVAGTVTVSTTAVTANSRIFLTVLSQSATVGALGIDNIVAGTSFDIVSTDGSDTSDVAWLIVEPL